jgi:hypothetical protein
MQQFFRDGRWLTLSQMKEYNKAQIKPKTVKKVEEEIVHEVTKEEIKDYLSQDVQTCMNDLKKNYENKGFSVSLKNEEYDIELYNELSAEFNLNDKPVLQLFCQSEKNVREFVKKYDSKVKMWDFNLGCPSKLSKKNEHGVFLHKHLEKVDEILSVIKKSTKKPLTTTMRGFWLRVSFFTEPRRPFYQLPAW